MTSRLPLVIAALVLLGLVSALFAPTIAWLVWSWRAHPYYHHGFLVLPAACWFAWRRRAELARDEPEAIGSAFLLAGLGVHLTALRWTVHPLSAAGLLLVLLGLSVFAGGRRAGRAALLPLVLVGLAVPLPFIDDVGPPMAAAIAHGAATAAGAIGVGVVQVGAQLVTSDGAFRVGAPCSGLHSLLALSTLAVVLAGALDGPRRGRLALVALAVPVALAANWLRLTGFLWLTGILGPERAMTWYHDYSSAILFLVASASLVALGTALGCRASRTA